MRGSWSRRHPATVALFAGILAALALLGPIRIPVAARPAAAHVGVVVTHSVVGHAPVWAALRTLRPRTGPARDGYPSAVVGPVVGLAVALLALAIRARRRITIPGPATRTPGVRGPPRTAV